VKKEYLALLQETSEIDRHSRYSELKKKLSNDPRYKAVESSSAREDWFRDYVRHLKDERKKDKDKDRRDKDKDKDRKDREKDRKEEKEESPKKDDGGEGKMDIDDDDEKEHNGEKDEPKSDVSLIIFRYDLSTALS